MLQNRKLEDIENMNVDLLKKKTGFHQNEKKRKSKEKLKLNVKNRNDLIENRNSSRYSISFRLKIHDIFDRILIEFSHLLQKSNIHLLDFSCSCIRCNEAA